MPGASVHPRHGARFVAYLSGAHCENCRNRRKLELHAICSEQSRWGRRHCRWHGFSLVCPVCHHGCSVARHSFRAEAAPTGPGELAAPRQVLEEEDVDLALTLSHYHKLGRAERRRYRSMLEQLGLCGLSERLHRR